MSAMTEQRQLGFFRKLFRDKASVFAGIILGLMLFLALFAQVIATDQPWYVSYKGYNWFPAFSSISNPNRAVIITNKLSGEKERIQFNLIEWKELKTDFILWAPVPYSPNKPDILNRDFTGPFDQQVMKDEKGHIVNSRFLFRHHFGTDNLGFDLLSGIIHGSKISIQVGFISVSIAALIGIILGAFAGYWGDYLLKIHRWRFLLLIPITIIGFFWAFISRSYILRDAMESGVFPFLLHLGLSLVLWFGLISLFFYVSGKLVNPKSRSAQINVPLDTIILRFTEVFNSIPKLIIIITIASLFREKTVGIVMIIIGLTSWTGIARFTRAEMLKTRSLPFIEAAKASGLSPLRVIFKHALPNAFAPVSIEIAFTIAAAILIESGLSFLGIGVPDDVITWGSILSAGRQQFDAWWMVVFPGAAIFLTVLSLNILGEKLREAVKP